MFGVRVSGLPRGCCSPSAAGRLVGGGGHGGGKAAALGSDDSLTSVGAGGLEHLRETTAAPTAGH